MRNDSCLVQVRVDESKVQFGDDISMYTLDGFGYHIFGSGGGFIIMISCSNEGGGGGEELFSQPYL